MNSSSSADAEEDNSAIAIFATTMLAPAAPSLAPAAPSQPPPFRPDYCQSVELYVFNPIAIVGRSLQILLCLATLMLLGRLLRAKRRSAGAKIFHVNFTILFENILLVCLLYCLGAAFLQFRYLLLYFTRTSACDLLTPLWYSIVARSPGYIHLLALPLLHFAIMCERVRATLFSRVYEREGTTFSELELATIWLISLIFSIFVVSSALFELNWEMILIYASLVSKYNSALVIVLQYVLSMLVVLTVGVDFWVVFYNRRQQRRKWAVGLDHSIRYNLSQKYQVNQNALSMRLMLPLDLSFAAIFLLYLLVSTSVRMLMAQNMLSMATFEAIYDWLFCLNMQHGILSIWLYTRFIEEIRCKKAKNKCALEVHPSSLSGQADAHFRQLKSQWA